MNTWTDPQARGARTLSRRLATLAVALLVLLAVAALGAA